MIDFAPDDREHVGRAAALYWRANKLTYVQVAKLFGTTYECIYAAVHHLRAQERLAAGLPSVPPDIEPKLLARGKAAATFAHRTHLTRDAAAIRFGVPLNVVIEAWIRLGLPTRVRT